MEPLRFALTPQHHPRFSSHRRHPRRSQATAAPNRSIPCAGPMEPLRRFPQLPAGRQTMGHGDVHFEGPAPSRFSRPSCICGRHRLHQFMRMTMLRIIQDTPVSAPTHWRATQVTWNACTSTLSPPQRVQQALPSSRPSMVPRLVPPVAFGGLRGPRFLALMACLQTFPVLKSSMKRDVIADNPMFHRLPAGNMYQCGQ